MTHGPSTSDTHDSFPALLLLVKHWGFSFARTEVEKSVDSTNCSLRKGVVNEHLSCYTLLRNTKEQKTEKKNCQCEQHGSETEVNTKRPTRLAGPILRMSPPTHSVTAQSDVAPPLTISVPFTRIFFEVACMILPILLVLQGQHNPSATRPESLLHAALSFSYIPRSSSVS